MGSVQLRKSHGPQATLRGGEEAPKGVHGRCDTARRPTGSDCASGIDHACLKDKEDCHFELFLLGRALLSGSNTTHIWIISMATPSLF